MLKYFFINNFKSLVDVEVEFLKDGTAYIYTVDGKARQIVVIAIP